MKLQEQINRIQEMMGIDDETPEDDYLFVRTDKFDNRGTFRKLPYDGIQCWFINKKDLPKYIEELELWGGNKKDIRIVEPTNKKIFAINYFDAHKYVMGESDKLPKLENFDEHKHRLKFIKQSGKSMLKYIGDMKYQIILI